jgi:hypothetical protein
VDVGQVLGRTTLTLCVRVRVVCVLVCFIFELVFRIKGWWEIGCQLITDFPNKLKCNHFERILHINVLMDENLCFDMNVIYATKHACVVSF